MICWHAVVCYIPHNILQWKLASQTEDDPASSVDSHILVSKLMGAAHINVVININALELHTFTEVLDHFGCKYAKL